MSAIQKLIHSAHLSGLRPLESEDTNPKNHFEDTVIGLEKALTYKGISIFKRHQRLLQETQAKLQTPGIQEGEEEGLKRARLDTITTDFTDYLNKNLGESRLNLTAKIQSLFSSKAFTYLANQIQEAADQKFQGMLMGRVQPITSCELIIPKDPKRSVQFKVELQSTYDTIIKPGKEPEQLEKPIYVQATALYKIPRSNARKPTPRGKATIQFYKMFQQEEIIGYKCEKRIDLPTFYPLRNNEAPIQRHVNFDPKKQHKNFFLDALNDIGDQMYLKEDRSQNESISLRQKLSEKFPDDILPYRDFPAARAAAMNQSFDNDLLKKLGKEREDLIPIIRALFTKKAFSSLQEQVNAKLKAQYDGKLVAKNPTPTRSLTLDIHEGPTSSAVITAVIQQEYDIPTQSRSVRVRAEADFVIKSKRVWDYHRPRATNGTITIERAVYQ